MQGVISNLSNVICIMLSYATLALPRNYCIIKSDLTIKSLNLPLPQQKLLYYQE